MRSTSYLCPEWGMTTNRPNVSPSAIYLKEKEGKYLMTVIIFLLVYKTYTMY